MSGAEIAETSAAVFFLTPIILFGLAMMILCAKMFIDFCKSVFTNEERYWEDKYDCLVMRGGATLNVIE